MNLEQADLVLLLQKWCEDSKHLLKLDLHLLVVEELVCQYETFIQIKSLLTDIKQRSVGEKWQTGKELI